MVKLSKKTYFVLVLISLDITASIVIFTIINKYAYYLPILGGLLGLLIGSIFETSKEQPNQFKPKYDKISLALLSVFIIFTIFLFSNFAFSFFNMMDNPGLFLILVFVDGILGAFFAAYRADRKNQWKKDHPT